MITLIWLQIHKHPTLTGLFGSGSTFGVSMLETFSYAAEIFKYAGMMAGGIVAILSLDVFLRKHYGKTFLPFIKTIKNDKESIKTEK